jgi:hypothetical protein
VADGSGGDGGGSCDLATPAAPIVLYYRDAQPATSADQIDYLFKVVNATGAAIPLSSLAVRYYFTNEVGPSGLSPIFYASTCCGPTSAMLGAAVTSTLHAMPAPVAAADSYLETTFAPSAGDLQDGDSVQIEVGFHAPAYTPNFDQSNDYSFSAANAATQAEWDLCPTQCTTFQGCKLTVYRDGALVWGAPP